MFGEVSGQAKWGGLVGGGIAIAGRIFEYGMDDSKSYASWKFGRDVGLDVLKTGGPGAAGAAIGTVVSAGVTGFATGALVAKGAAIGTMVPVVGIAFGALVGFGAAWVLSYGIEQGYSWADWRN